MKELTYQYLRLAHPELKEKVGDSLNSGTSLNREDSFLKIIRRVLQKAIRQKGISVKGRASGTGRIRRYAWVYADSAVERGVSQIRLQHQ